MKQRENLRRLVLVMLLLYSLWHYVGARQTLERTEMLSAELQQERDALEAEQRLLRKHMAELETEEGLESAARERLGLVKPGELIFYVIDGDDAAQPQEENTITDREERPWEWK